MSKQIAAKLTISCSTKKERDAIKLALEDETTRAFVVVMGNLLQLPSDRARMRVLQFGSDKLDEEKPDDLLTQIGERG